MSDREDEFGKIKKEYQKVIEEAGEKVNLAEDSYSLVDKYMRKLDQELLKFKLELEADNRGITEILEKRSLEMDQPSANLANHKENRLPKKVRKHLTTAHAVAQVGSAAAQAGMMQSKPQYEGLSFETLQAVPSASSSSGVGQANNSSYPLQHMGAGGNAIAQAASQAIAATQQLTGRRTSSLKASFEAINMGLQTHEFSIGGELASAAQSALAASSLSSGFDQPSTKRKKVAKIQPNPVLDVGGTFDESPDDVLQLGRVANN